MGEKHDTVFIMQATIFRSFNNSSRKQKYFLKKLVVTKTQKERREAALSQLCVRLSVPGQMSHGLHRSRYDVFGSSCITASPTCPVLSCFICLACNQKKKDRFYTPLSPLASGGGCLILDFYTSSLRRFTLRCGGPKRCRYWESDDRLVDY